MVRRLLRDPWERSGYRNDGPLKYFRRIVERLDRRRLLSGDEIENLFLRFRYKYNGSPSYWTVDKLMDMGVFSVPFEFGTCATGPYCDLYPGTTDPLLPQTCLCGRMTGAVSFDKRWSLPRRTSHLADQVRRAHQLFGSDGLFSLRFCEEHKEIENFLDGVRLKKDTKKVPMLRPQYRELSDLPARYQHALILARFVAYTARVMQSQPSSKTGVRA